MANIIWLTNPFDISEMTVEKSEDNQTIQSWLDCHGGLNRLNRMPTVCVYNGQQLMRSEYNRVIVSDVCFVTLPTGGDSGSNPLAAAAMIALSAYTGGLADAAIAAGSNAFAVTAANIAVNMAGAALINAVLPPPDLPYSAAPSQGSPTYSLQAQGNAARLGSPIPVNYGRMRIYPDFAAIPYTEYEENEQYLYQLFCIGQGENRVTDIRLDNTPIENFADVTTEIAPPPAA